MNYLTKENITFALALLGSIGTACNWFYIYCSNRKKIGITVFDYVVYPNSAVQFFVHIQNRSLSPICIISFALFLNGKEVACELSPKKIRGAGSDLITSSPFPINLAPKQGYQCYLEFIKCKNISLIPDKKVVFVIHTNRGPIKKCVTLGGISHYLHIE